MENVDFNINNEKLRLKVKKIVLNTIKKILGKKLKKAYLNDFSTISAILSPTLKIASLYVAVFLA